MPFQCRKRHLARINSHPTDVEGLPPQQGFNAASGTWRASTQWYGALYSIVVLFQCRKRHLARINAPEDAFDAIVISFQCRKRHLARINTCEDGISTAFDLVSMPQAALGAHQLLRYIIAYTIAVSMPQAALGAHQHPKMFLRINRLNFVSMPQAALGAHQLPLSSQSSSIQVSMPQAALGAHQP